MIESASWLDQLAAMPHVVVESEKPVDEQKLASQQKGSHVYREGQKLPCRIRTS